MKLILFSIGLFLVNFPAFAQADVNTGESSKNTADIEREILRLEEVGRQKTLAGDKNWDDLWADGAYLIAADGSIINYRKGQDLSAGMPPPKSMKLSEMIVRVSGETAVVTGLAEVGMETAEKKPYSFKLRFLNVWKKMPEGWKITVAERTAVKQSPPSGSNSQITEKPKIDDASDVEKRLRVERIAATNILYLETSGSYYKHPQIIGQLLQFAQRNYATAGTIFGIYPVDPDSVGVPFAKQQTAGEETRRAAAANPANEKKLVWGIAVRVIPGQPDATKKAAENADPFFISATESELTKALSALKKATKPFELKRLPETTAIVLETDVNRSPADGLALNAWMVKNGYVQTGATRMEMAMNRANPANALTKIIIPVEKRKSGLSANKKSR